MIADEESGDLPPNTSNYYEVTKKDLPLHCPMPGMSLWNSHPRVYLAIEKTGDAKCAYCGAVFRLVERNQDIDAA
ncbi:MAG: zinc-finger domain-containing protein [Gammaproteobacteria bacterium]|nr:zinc-finger domain-containing protein [Gammaproteobacteria bacterium]NNF65997.1 zinc-finger domain-containing protein [Gammaproteobacteria bacterium]